MPCSNCRESGHNVRTCPRKSDSTNLTRKLHTKTGQKYSSSDSDYDKIMEKRGVSQNLTPGQWAQLTAAEVRLQRCDDVANKFKKGLSSLTSVDDDLTKAQKCSKGCESSSENESGSENETDCESNSETENSEQEETTQVKKSVVFKQPKHFVATKTPQKASSSSSKSYIIDSDEVQARLEQGMTAKEGPGYIYMYKIDDNSKVHEDLYKIGMSKNLPERRIKATGYNNKENYASVFSVPVTCRFMVEKITHLQLIAGGRQRIREEIVDGKNEWFLGDRKKLEEVIRFSKKLVEKEYP